MRTWPCFACRTTATWIPDSLYRHLLVRVHALTEESNFQGASYEGIVFYVDNAEMPFESVIDEVREVLSLGFRVVICAAWDVDVPELVDDHPLPRCYTLNESLIYLKEQIVGV